MFPREGEASVRGRVLMPARTEPRRPPKGAFPDSQDHVRSFSGRGRWVGIRWRAWRSVQMLVIELFRFASSGWRSSDFISFRSASLPLAASSRSAGFPSFSS